MAGKTSFTASNPNRYGVSKSIVKTVLLPGPPAQSNTSNQETSPFFTAGSDYPWIVSIDNVGPTLAVIALDAAGTLAGPVAQIGSDVLRIPAGKSHALRLAPGQAMYGMAVGASGQITLSAHEDVVFTKAVC